MEDPGIMCVSWQKALEEVGFEHPDLNAREFLMTHNLLKQSGNTSSFRSIQELARSEPQYIRVKGWSWLFFFISSRGWELLVGQVNRLNYSVRAILGVVRDDKSFRPTATPEKVSHIELIWAWVKAHLDDILFEAVLDDNSLRRYLPPQANLHFAGDAIPKQATIPKVHTC